MSELITVTVTPQGTADVYIGSLHIKTFGGTVAHQAASDFAQQIKNELSAHKSVGSVTEEDKADDQTRFIFGKNKRT